MREEVAAAVVFLTRLVRYHEGLSKEKAEDFSDKLTAVLVDKFKNHWYSAEPVKGQAYRCIRINEAEPVDPVLDKVAAQCNLRYADLHLPSELTLWIDPNEVTCRVGETTGVTYTVASFQGGQPENRAQHLDLGDMLRLHHQQKSNELYKFREAARRRANKASFNGVAGPAHHPAGPPHLRNKRSVFHTVDKRPFFANSSNNSSSKNYSLHNPPHPVSKRLPVIHSPHSGSPPTAGPPGAHYYSPLATNRDRFRWVRGQDLVTAQ